MDVEGGRRAHEPTGRIRRMPLTKIILIIQKAGIWHFWRKKGFERRTVAREGSLTEVAGAALVAGALGLDCFFAMVHTCASWGLR